MQTNEFFFTFLKKIILTIPVFCQLLKLNVKKTNRILGIVRK